MLCLQFAAVAQQYGPFNQPFELANIAGEGVARQQSQRLITPAHGLALQKLTRLNIVADDLKAMAS